MHLSDFHFDLPSHLIAQYPVARGESRLLIIDRARDFCEDHIFQDLIDWLVADDLLVFNDTRVIPARLFGHKNTGGQVEILVERILTSGHILAQIRGGKSLLSGHQLILDQAIKITVLAKQDGWFELRFEDDRSVLEILNKIGHIPLPPYIQRPDEVSDWDWYQTVYARHPGAIATPTAGLHFNQLFLDRLAKKGIKMAYVTLHVGAGTFQPIRVADVTKHQMHREWVAVSEETCKAVNLARTRGRKVIAIGTTSVRALESASKTGQIQPFYGETDLFIYPGYTFKSVDALLTNFHLPASSLLMLVCAFAGHERVLSAYQQAVAKGYRFFSYGDAMFIK